MITKNYIPLLLLCLLGAVLPVFGQKPLKPHLASFRKAEKPYRVEDAGPLTPWKTSVPAAGAGLLSSHEVSFPTLNALSRPSHQGVFRYTYDEATGLPILIEGEAPGEEKSLDWREKSRVYLEAVKEAMHIREPALEFETTGVGTDELGQTHIRARQRYRGVEVYGGEIVLHGRDGKVQSLNGRYFPTPALKSVSPALPAGQAERIVREQLAAQGIEIKILSPEALRLIPGSQTESRLVVYHAGRRPDAERLAWRVAIHPSVAVRWAFLIDANTGEVLRQWRDQCQFHDDSFAADRKAAAPMPPGTAKEADLLGVTRDINTWREAAGYYLIDGSKSMFNATQSQMPGEPVGAIITLDMRNVAVNSEDLTGYLIFSANNVWGNPTAVSAHFNAGQAFDYYRKTFGRNSINGEGGNILSGVNVADEDGGGFDNAFWNGKAMFYGNGRTLFKPLARALDVAGHEMSHGVIQSTAALEYEDEPGAINESMADVFGALIDRDDWKMGEDVVNTAVYKSGALRDMSNPSNGGTKFGDRGWQPDHVSKQYRGNEDNGGVHINSGIPNRAFYLFATAVGKDKAEKVYYRALTTYLTRFSQFIDLRIAVIKAAGDLYGANGTEAQAAGTAFSTVGVNGSQGTPTQTDAVFNPGENFILYTDANKSVINLSNPKAEQIAAPLSTVGPLSKPSVTDDGSVIVYVASDKTLRAIVLDWAKGTYSETVISNEKIWRNVAVSKDGSKLAALFDDLSNLIYVYDLASKQAVEYELYNPTFTEGVTTKDVQYADAIEWDFSGQYIMYDAFNIIESDVKDIEYWDIGFIQVWDNDAKDFSDGRISKLYNAIPEGVSIGNPTFSKNSPYIIAFDYVETFDENYYLLGVNTQTGKEGTIFNNVDLGFPSFSVDDSQLLFDAQNSSGKRVLGVIKLAADKINAAPSPPASVLISGGSPGARWGVWFANGERVITGTDEALPGGGSLEIFPNPFEATLYLRGNAERPASLSVELFDLLGRRVFGRDLRVGAGEWQESIDVPGLVAGTYSVRVSDGVGSVSKKIFKTH